MDQVTHLIRLVQQAFADNPERSFTARQMYKYLGIKQDRDKAIVKQALVDMEAQGLLKEVKEGKYKPSPKSSLTTKPKAADVKKQEHTGRIRHDISDSELDKPDTLVGTFLMTNRGGIVCGISDKQIRDNVVVRSGDTLGAHDGEKVVVQLTFAGNSRRLPEGRVIEVLGTAGDNDTEMHAILSEYGLPYNYPPKAEQQADTIDAGITESEIASRTDMRDRLTFTIDPADAKDFDDALSFFVVEGQKSKVESPQQSAGSNQQSAVGSQPSAENKEENVLYEIGVHIADVTHYVKPGSDIDHEAYRRGTSVYLVDRTIPMLPHHLSDELCSLRENEDKLCFSVIFHIDNEANVKDFHIKRTVIRSDKRLNYGQVQDLFDSQPDGIAVSDDLRNALFTLNRLAKILRQRRMEAGALEFDREEMLFRLDPQGRPVSVYTKHQTEANNLIEEFMLLANRTVAETASNIIKSRQPSVVSNQQAAVGSQRSATIKEFVYRIHDVPDPDKLNSLSKFIHKFGYNLKTQVTRAQALTRNINAILRESKGKAEENLIELLTIRSMAKAVYSTDNIGHYGLAFRHYTHFTSPIRRYPDMMVHRLLEQALLGAHPDNPAPYEKELEDACQHCSAREQLAAAAERASVKYKQAEFLQDKVGQQFDGHITGVTEYGLYIQLDDNHCEGMVPIRFIFKHDYAYFIEEEYCIAAERSDKRYRLGDAVKVSVVSCDLERKQIDLAIVEE